MSELTADRLQTLRQTETWFRLVVENVETVIYLATADLSEVLYVNSAYEELYGEPVESLSERPTSFVEAAHPEDRTRYERDIDEMLADIDAGDVAEVYEGEYRLRVDGETKWVRVARYPVETEDGRIDHVVGTVEDVTDERELERTYQDVFEHVSDGLVVHDPETGEILDVNSRYCDLTGYTHDELVGADIGLVMTDDPEHSEAAAKARIEAARDEGPQLFEWPGERKGGERFEAEINLAIVELEGDECVLASVRDITGRKRNERVIEALHRSTERIQHAETTQAVCEATVTAMEEVLDLSLPACWLHREREDGPVLEPVAASEDAWAFAGGPGPLEPGTFEYALFEEDESARYDPSENWDRTPLEHALMVPIADHGVIGAADPDVDAFDDVVFDAAHILARHTTTALDRVQRAAERRESDRQMRAVVDRIDEAIFLTDGTRLLDDTRGSVYVSAGYEDVFGLSYDDLAADDSMDFVGLVHPDDRESYQTTLRTRVRAVENGTHDDRYSSEYRIRRPDGEVRWVRSDFYPLEWTDGDDRFVVVSRDVTERKEREDTLETFHEATRELTKAGSRQEASQVAVDAAAEVLGFSHVSIHLYDESEGALRPVGETAALRSALDFLPSFEPGENLPWQTFVEGEAVRGTEIQSETGLYGPAVDDPDLVLPLGPHGVMLVGGTDEGTAETVELAQILAATLEGALNHVQGQNELREREDELRTHRERADRLERLNTVIREIEQATVEESTRDAIERTVCDQLTTVDSYQVAWVAEPNRANEVLVPRMQSGGDAGYVDTLTVDLDDGGLETHPAARAYSAGETQRANRLATSVARGGWRKPLLRAGYQSLLAVPLAHGESIYGVLCLVADDPTAFDDRSETVLTELGRSVGYALSVLERRRALESDTTTELEFTGWDDDLLFVRLADRVDAAVTLERTVRRENGRVATFYTVDGATPERVRADAEALDSVIDATLVSADEPAPSSLVEIETPSWFGHVFVDHGALVQVASAEPADSDARLVVEVPQVADVRALVSSFREEYSDTELVAQRTRERSVGTLFELQDLLEDRLTSRQREVLETAYSAGYFDWPRESSGQEIAELLDITQPTLNKHLRTVERKTFSMLLDREPPD